MLISMAPDPADPIVFASIHLLLHKQERQMTKPSRSRSSSASKASTSSSSGYGVSRRQCKRKSKSKSNNNGKVPLHYLKPGALAQLRDAHRTARVSLSCSQKKKKRAEGPEDDSNNEETSTGAQQVDLLHGEMERNAAGPHEAHVPAVASMTPGPSLRMFGPLCPQRKKLLAPKTPLPPPAASVMVAPVTPVHNSSHIESDSGDESLLESLPLELLVRIVCNLHHDQLQPTFHVSKRLRQAVLIARQCHFDYTTPDRDRQDVLQTITPRAELNWPFQRAGAAGAGPSRPPTPQAPRQAPKPLQARISLAEMQQLAGPLFQGSNNHVRRLKPPSLLRPAYRAMASHRALFYEDELCQAVAQNSL